VCFSGAIHIFIRNHPTSIRLPKSLEASLKRRAKERRWSLSTLINQVLEAWDKKEAEREKK